ncbi:hypothetical protein [Tessaracoccus flavescens]|uniref:Uncharacterized protein n=1 Tax=Tessaracoccus flavescens TaxID=399497 RepID=A0A1Q2CWH7_9ACTN|nr:hypothetical protein [Tessaracoccus flavescens]AQP50466.1 hypothetical protein BW733_06110 [Tessaracoccus flavescens]
MNHSTVTAGRTVTVSGEGCGGEGTYIASVAVEFGGDTYHVDTRGQWSTVFQVPENMSGPQEVKASCGWTYASSTIEVVADGAEGLDPRGVLLVTDAVVSVGRYFNVYGAGCAAGSTIEFTFGSQATTLEERWGQTWAGGPIQAPPADLGEQTVTATCSGPGGTWTHPPVAISVVERGDHGASTPGLPVCTGSPQDDRYGSCPSTYSPTPSPTKPGLPSTGG